MLNQSKQRLDLKKKGQRLKCSKCPSKVHQSKQKTKSWEAWFFHIGYKYKILSTIYKQQLKIKVRVIHIK